MFELSRETDVVVGRDHHYFHYRVYSPLGRNTLDLTQTQIRRYAAGRSVTTAPTEMHIAKPVEA